MSAASSLSARGVSQVTWCEIDGDVVEAAKKYMPNVAIAVSAWAPIRAMRHNIRPFLGSGKWGTWGTQ